MNKIALLLLFGSVIVLAQTTLEESASAGESVYQSNCLSCHQANGQGVPSAFPPLDLHAAQLVNAEGGRAYLSKVLLYGVMGEIEVDSANYNGVMTPWAHLADEDLANVLNYVLSSWSNVDLLAEDFEPFVAEEVAAQRDLDLDFQKVFEERQKLDLE